MCARGGAPQGRRERARDARAPQAATCAQLPTQGRQGARANVRGLVLTSPPPPPLVPSLVRPPQHYTPQQTPTSWPTVPSTAARAIESLRNTATADTAGDSVCP